MLVFGPVPSRRLGRSLGVNNIPAKHCTYSCVYCQVGSTARTESDRRSFHATSEIAATVGDKIRQCRASGQEIDYLTFVPDGEPTLDMNLGREISALKPFGVPVAVITNASLLHRSDVRNDLASADLVSIKVDTLNEVVWRRLNRPPGDLSLDPVLDGIREFAGSFRGDLLSETMLVKGLNGDAASVSEVAAFLEPLNPDRSYLAVPVRPPADARARPPDPESLVEAYEIMRARLPRTELLAGGEIGKFGRTGDPTEDLLSILAVHPMREGSVKEFLAEAGQAAELLERLLGEGIIARVEHLGGVFYVRRFPSPGRG